VTDVTEDIQALKRAAALHAVQYVHNGMKVGLGTGTTAEYAVRELGARVARGLRIICVPTSVRTERLARELGIPLTTLEDTPELDITIDGADEVDLTTFNAIKGLGGALLREKIVALASKLEVLIVDERKIVSRLGEHAPVPVEVVPFGWNRTCEALARLGCRPERRTAPDGEVYITDSGNYLIDCYFPLIADPPSLAERIKCLTGVVEHGLFVGIAGRVVVGRTNGVQVVDRGRT
jgi:ribose 5-phosphate isomerase A